MTEGSVTPVTARSSDQMGALVEPMGQRAGGLLVQTLGSAIKHAHTMVGDSERRRSELIRYALDRGATTREIADLLGVTNSTVWRWGGGKRGSNVLNEPLAPVADNNAA